LERKRKYIRLYSNAILLTEVFETLVNFVCCYRQICLIDFDAYNHTRLTKNKIIYNLKKKIKHAFCLTWLLQEILNIIKLKKIIFIVNVI